MSYGPLQRGGSCHTGSEERWPSMFAHAMGHDVFRGTAGAVEGAEGEGSGRKEKRGREEKRL